MAEMGGAENSLPHETWGEWEERHLPIEGEDKLPEPSVEEWRASLVDTFLGRGFRRDTVEAGVELGISWIEELRNALAGRDFSSNPFAMDEFYDAIYSTRERAVRKLTHARPVYPGYGKLPLMSVGAIAREVLLLSQPEEDRDKLRQHITAV